MKKLLIIIIALVVVESKLSAGCDGQGVAVENSEHTCNSNWDCSPGRQCSEESYCESC